MPGGVLQAQGRRHGASHGTSAGAGTGIETGTNAGLCTGRSHGGPARRRGHRARYCRGEPGMGSEWPVGGARGLRGLEILASSFRAALSFSTCPLK